MAPMTPRLKILSVGGNPVSAFLSWRLQATNACDVTLVWKAGYEHVAQYGISMKSPIFGNERFKPRHVVRQPEDAANLNQGAFDYVILCIKALPDVYDLAGVVEAVVTPQHTCILINTTHSLGVEKALEERFPTNVVLSLVSGAELTQLGQSEFEHKGSTEIWVGPANKNDAIPATIQEDMAQALAMTLSTGQVDCKVSSNIRQQQYERLIGPIAFHPISVIFETPNHASLLEKVGVRELITEVMDELLQLADAQDCKLPPSFKQQTMDEMSRPSTTESIMWQDYVAKRPMEVETFLGSPIKLARDVGLKVPRIETLYAILHNLNIANRQRPKLVEPTGLPPNSPSPAAPSPLPRLSSQQAMRPMMNGAPNGNGNGMPPRGPPRPRNSNMGPPGMRRPPPHMNGGPPNGMRGPMPGGPPNGYASSRAASRRGSMDGADLDEFSHVVLYEDGADGGFGDPADLALRERELQLRQRELALREQELRMRRGPGPPSRRGPPMPPPMRGQMLDDEDDEEDYFDPNSGPSHPMVDSDNFDMMSVTSRKNRAKMMPSARDVRRNPEMDGGGMGPGGMRGSRYRPGFNRNRSSQIGVAHEVGTNPLDDPLLSSTSNRYANVDRGAMQAESRANSLTAAKLDELQHFGPGPGGPVGPPMGPGGPMGMNGAFPRRASHSPAQPYSPSVRGMNGRPSPPNGFGPSMNGRPSPPNGMQQPIPRYPPGHGNSVAPQAVEQHVGVSSLQPPKPKNVRSLTGSASASAGSGESEPSANSSASSLGPRAPIGVR